MLQLSSDRSLSSWRDLKFTIIFWENDCIIQPWFPNFIIAPWQILISNPKFYFFRKRCRGCGVVIRAVTLQNQRVSMIRCNLQCLQMIPKLKALKRCSNTDLILLAWRKQQNLLEELINVVSVNFNMQTECIAIFLYPSISSHFVLASWILNCFSLLSAKWFEFLHFTIFLNISEAIASFWNVRFSQNKLHKILLLVAAMPKSGEKSKLPKSKETHFREYMFTWVGRNHLSRFMEKLPKGEKMIPQLCFILAEEFYRNK